MQREFNADRYEQYVRFADALITEVSKEDIAQCARILAFALARYQATYGELPKDEELSQLGSVGRNPASDKMRADGIKVPAIALSPQTPADNAKCQTGLVKYVSSQLSASCSRLTANTACSHSFQLSTKATSSPCARKSP